MLITKLIHKIKNNRNINLIDFFKNCLTTSQKKKLKIYEKYYLRCKFLNENHLKILAQIIQSFETKRVQGDHFELLELMKVTLKETFELAFNEYDKCLKRMIKFNYEAYQTMRVRSRLTTAIEFKVKRLDLLLDRSKTITQL